MLPPVPPVPRKHHRPVTETVKGAGAAKLIQRTSKLVTVGRTLAWEWLPTPGNDWSNVVFVVLTSPDLRQWKPWLTVATNRLTFQTTDQKAFFTVYVSNTMSHLTSE